MEKLFLEANTIKQVSEPVDLNAAAITGARIHAGKGKAIAVLISLGDSLTGANCVFTLKKHTAASGGTTADLEVANPYYVKAGAATKFTKVVPGSAAAEYDLSATFDTEPGMVVFEVLSEDLGEEYTHFSINAEDGAVTKIFSGLYVVKEARLQPAYDLDT